MRVPSTFGDPIALAIWLLAYFCTFAIILAPEGTFISGSSVDAQTSAP